MGNDTVPGLLRDDANYLTPEQAADYLGLTVATVYRKLNSGDLTGFQIERQWRIPPAELLKLIDRENR